MFHRDSRNVRDYVAKLKKAFPGLQYELCQEYITFYEIAVFSDYRFSYKEYARFMRILVEMVSILHEKAYNIDDI